MESVCVIGAGGAGLAAAQALASRQIPFVVHEAGSGIGGNWRYDNDSGLGSTYESLTTNVSRQRTSFRCFPFRQGPTYLHHSEMLAYLESFADRFGLREHIRHRSMVVSVRPCGEGSWEVATVGGERQRHRAVIVATGYNSEPRYPDLPGRFDGLEMHAHHYRSPEPFEDRDAVVIGLGCSAAELACEIRSVARSTAIAARSGNWVVRRRLGGVPFDWIDTRTFGRLPFGVRRTLAGPAVRLAGRDLGPQLGAPTGRVLDKPWAVCDHLLREIRSHRITLAPAVVELTGDGVRLADGRLLPADAILYATGYRTHHPFLEPQVGLPTQDHAPLYRGVAHPTAPGLYFVGLAMVHGALLPVFEAQANWVGEVLADRLQLPPLEQMQGSIAGDDAIRRRDFDPRWGILWDRVPYIRALEGEARRARRSPGLARRAQLATLR